jgi:hypothetical protein
VTEAKFTMQLLELTSILDLKFQISSLRAVPTIWSIIPAVLIREQTSASVCHLHLPGHRPGTQFQLAQKARTWRTASNTIFANHHLASKVISAIL